MGWKSIGRWEQIGGVMAGEGMIYECNGIPTTFSIDFDFE